MRAFYGHVGYGGGVRADDTVILARDSGSIIAAVRLCIEQQRLVLRGMQVATRLRGVGLGGRLLRVTADTIGDRWCWCIPHRHLVRFYQTVGFAEATAEMVPDFYVSAVHALRTRWQPGHRDGAPPMTRCVG